MTQLRTKTGFAFCWGVGICFHLKLLPEGIFFFFGGLVLFFFFCQKACISPNPIQGQGGMPRLRFLTSPRILATSAAQSKQAKGGWGQRADSLCSLQFDQFLAPTDVLAEGNPHSRELLHSRASSSAPRQCPCANSCISAGLYECFLLPKIPGKTQPSLPTGSFSVSLMSPLSTKISVFQVQWGTE